VAEISILMSVRNGGPYLDETIASICAQTWRDWEFIIVDNASTDGTGAVLERWAAADGRIRVVRNPENLGHSGGLNRGLELCSGRWIARIDADDVAAPCRLERQLAFLEANPDVSVASCLAYYIDEKGRRAGKTFHALTTREAFVRHQQDGLAIGILHPGAIMDRELLCRLGGYRSAYDPANDIELWARMADAGALILVQPEYLMNYRVHSRSETAQDFVYARLKYQWARDSMRARRAGRPEPAWEDYIATRAAAPWWVRLNRWRKTHARRLYRAAAQSMMRRRAIRAVMEAGAATLLQPSYTLPRFRGQRLR
jgi:glycosyltransferase involved in cell wall biosynthesis